MLPPIDGLLQRYQGFQRSAEDETIRGVNQALDEGFVSLLRKIRRIGKGDFSSLEAVARVAAHLGGLLTETRQHSAVQLQYEKLLTRSTELGLDLSDRLMKLGGPGLELRSVDIPIEVIQQQALSAKGYLQRWGDQFANDATVVMQKRLAMNSDIDAIVGDLRQRLAITKSRAEAIARTESQKANMNAAFANYSANGFDHVIFYATADERTCAICAPRSGNIYRRTDLQMPLHPNCRCVARPAMILPENEKQILSALRRHHREVMSHFKQVGQKPEPVAPFEDQAPVPVWTPTGRKPFNG